MTQINFNISISPWVRCLKCSERIPFAIEQLAGYFETVPLTCSSCHASHDWWSIALREIEENFMLNQAFFFVGASTTIFKLHLKPGQRLMYRFSDYGIPVDSKILYVNYTPNGGGLFPLELHGNVSTRRFRSNEVTVFPAPFAADQAMADTEVNVMTSWVPSAKDDDSLQSLIDAFETYAIARYSAMVVPANVAVESALSRLLTPFLEKFVSKKRAEEFLETSATYSDQLNVVLPVITGLLKLPPLPNHVRGILNRLRSLRNQLAHSGVLDNPLNAKEAAELLCGSLFGLHYVRFLQPKIEFGRSGTIK